jgi:ABC-type nitrate/sulfonate/bicarbonate transport system permease component
MTAGYKRWIWHIGSVLATLVIVLLWQAMTAWSHLVSPVFLPSPMAALTSLQEGIADGSLLPQVLATTQRMLIGWLLASLLGIGLGAVIGVSTAARTWLQPMLEFIRPLPASALMPVAIALFGLSPQMVLAVVAFGAVWPILLATVHGFAAVDPRLEDVAKVLRLSRAAFVVKIGLPNALPDIFAGMRLSLTVALIVSVVGEMLASQTGLGMSILLAARSFHSADLFAGVVLLGSIGYLGNAALQVIEGRVLRWQNT